MSRIAIDASPLERRTLERYGIEVRPDTLERLRTGMRAAGLAPEQKLAPGTKPAENRVRPWHPYRSKWEQQYAERLRYEQAIGLIQDWSYETERLVIGEGAHYTPDFPVTRCDGVREMREVKGYRREAAMVRIRAAARQYPKLVFVLVTKLNGEWTRTTIGGRR